MVTNNPKAQYHSIYFGARASIPCSTVSKSNNRLNAASPVTNIEKPILNGVAELVSENPNALPKMLNAIH